MNNNILEKNPKLEIFDLDLEWKKKDSDKRYFKVPGLPNQKIDIQTISNDTLEEIFKSRKFELDNIPKKDEVIEKSGQSKYYKQVKQQLEEQLNAKKFAIIEGPTGTGKTTLAKTLAYESGLELYEVGANYDKTVDDYSTDIKTTTKNNILQIQTTAGPLEKAISKGGIFLVNEANALNSDISLALANMIESGFIVVGNKKIKVHPNFKLIFTSNNAYSGTTDYNSAVKRKAGGIINLDYEPNVDGEYQIVKNIYNKVKAKLNIEVLISEEDLLKITTQVRKLREQITEDGELKSQDFNNFGDFLYIRLYEKLFSSLLVSEKSDFKTELTTLLDGFLQEHIVGAIGTDYVSHYNPKEKLHSFIEDLDLDIGVEKGGKKVISEEFNEILKKVLGDKKVNTSDFLEKNNLISNGNTGENGTNGGNNIYIPKPGFNPNLLKNTLQNEKKSVGEELERIEFLGKLAEDIHTKILESRNEKIIEELEVIESNGRKFLKAKINSQELYFFLKEGKNIKNINLEDINKENFKDYVFGNNDIKVLLQDDNGNSLEYENPFDNPKSLELRKFSKIISRKIDDKQIVTFLGFKAEPRDIRYKGKESEKLYIPQSKVNDILMSNYEIVDKSNEYFTKKKEGQHILVLTEANKVSFIKKSDYKSESGKILKPLDKKGNLNSGIENEIRNKFGNIDKLNLTNGGIEKSQTATPTNISGIKYPISSEVEKVLENTPSFGEQPSKSTKETLDKIILSLQTGNDVLLTGPSGVGKSTYALDVAKNMNLPYISMQVTSDMTEEDLLGKNEFNEGLLEKRKSAFLDYYINGGIVELKELNTNPDMTFLNNFLDKNGTITFDGETYKRHPNFHIIATINPFDNRLFEGTGAMNLATQARFVNIDINYIKDLDEETELLFNYTKITNNEIIESFSSEKDFKNYIKGSLEKIVHTIRNKLEELKKTQTTGNDELLKFIAGKIVTIDIYQKWLKNSKNQEDIIRHFKDFYNISEEENNIPGIKSIKDILQIIK